MCQPECMAQPPMVRRVLLRLPPPMRAVLLHARGDYGPWEEGFDFIPPGLAPGEVAGPPDFVGVGVQKGGTSWWFELILEHPGVYQRSGIPKERHYLSRFCIEPFGPSEVDAYRGWFPRAEGTITGEWTPDYFHYPWVPPLLAAAAPDTKILLLVRDPVERFRSGLTFRLRMGAPHTSARASTPDTCVASWSSSRPSRSWCCSTSSAAPTRPPSWPGPTSFSGSTPSIRRRSDGRSMSAGARRSGSTRPRPNGSPTSTAPMPLNWPAWCRRWI
jgi:hypothetical protein